MIQLPLSQIITAASLSAAVACGWLCLRLARQAREAVQHLMAVANEHEGELSQVRQELKTVSQYAAEQQHRLSQLESARRPAPAPIKPVEEPVAPPQYVTSPIPTQPGRLSMTERRHRVLALARRGLDVGVIATSLGLPHGEVELIIEINKAALESQTAFS